MNNKKLLSIIYIIVVMIMVVVTMLLVENKDKNYWISIVFILIAVTAVFISDLDFTKAELKNIPVEFPFISISTGYLTAVVVIIIIFKMLIKIIPTWYFSIHFISLAVFAIVSILMIMGRRNIINLSQKTQDAVVDNKMLCADIESIKQRTSNLRANIKSKVLVLLNDVYEKIKYSDPILHESVFQIDYKIREKIVDLSTEVDVLINSKTEDLSNIKSIVTAIDKLIVDRNNRIKVLK